MRKTFNGQMKIGAIDIASIEIDKKSRDEVPKTLLSLQYIFTNSALRSDVFRLLDQVLPTRSLKGIGRNGMSAWEILVLASIRMSCSLDYDHLKEVSDNHANVRLMLGLSPIVDQKITFGLQTLKDNIALLPEEVLRQINQIVVKRGQTLMGKKANEPFLSRCDSFVVKTDVHYPTDISLLFDAIRKVIVLISRFCDLHNIPGWRQSRFNIKAVKKRYRKAQKLKHSTSRNPEIRQKRADIIRQAYLSYLEIVRNYLEKTLDTLQLISDVAVPVAPEIPTIRYYIEHAERQIDQTYRRVIQNESIPHCEKVFSIFETHTEWISKGKAGVPQELGKRVAIVEDEYGFIIDHQIGDNETDDQIAVPLVMSAKKAFTDLNGCSFDKGFYTPGTRDKLKTILDQVVLPKKGKRNQEQHQEENDIAFRKARKQHSAVESAIHSLQNHGLNKCKDKGIDGFHRYVAMGVLAFNIHKLGAVIQEQHRKNETRRRKYRETYHENKTYQAA